VLKKIALLRERVANRDDYPFFVPVIRNLDKLTLKPRICFFAGENGTGKSTVLEAIGAHYGFMSKQLRCKSCDIS
jgi:predicted ATPase